MLDNDGVGCWEGGRELTLYSSIFCCHRSFVFYYLRSFYSYGRLFLNITLTQKKIKYYFKILSKKMNAFPWHFGSSLQNFSNCCTGIRGYG